MLSALHSLSLSQSDWSRRKLLRIPGTYSYVSWCCPQLICWWEANGGWGASASCRETEIKKLKLQQQRTFTFISAPRFVSPCCFLLIQLLNVLPEAFVDLMCFLFIRCSPSTYFHLLFMYFLLSRSFSSDAVPFLSPAPLQLHSHCTLPFHLYQSSILPSTSCSSSRQCYYFKQKYFAFSARA